MDRPALAQGIPLIPLESLAPDSARGLEVRLGDETLPLILVRHREGVSAFRNRCPHAGTPLDWMPDAFFNLEGTHLQCATHAALFDPVSGACVAGPCAGDGLETFPVEVDEQGVVRLMVAR